MELRAVLMPAVPIAVEAAVAAIRERGPYADLSEDALDRNLRIGLTDAVERWFDPTDAGGRGDLHFTLGRAHARAGRSLDELMGFYRIAALTMWRRLAEIGAAGGVEPKHLYRLAETGFGCVDELSTQAAAGFADEASHRSGAAHSRRTELVQLLMRRPQPALDALQAAARAVGIELAATLALFVGPADRYDAFARSVRDPVVLGPREGEFVGVMLDPDGPLRRHELAVAAARAEVQLALGSAVPIAQARTSLTRARALRVLMQAGLVDRGPLVDAEDHDVELLLSAAPQLGSELAQQRLAPLEAVRGETKRANLYATLNAWLASPGQRKTIAHALGVHPQTVRYRMARLRELFDTALDDPDSRFELQLALRLRPYARLAALAESPDAASIDGRANT
jgi:PucR C-terminal helix-turn-helix domain